MRNNITAYKIVKKDRKGNLFSVIRDSWNEVKYKKDHLTRPNEHCNQFLFIFKNRTDAKRFRDSHTYPKNSTELWQVKANNVEERKLCMNAEFIESSFCPMGTLFCSSLKLIKKIS